MFESMVMEGGGGRRFALATTSLGMQVGVAGVLVMAAWMAPVPLPAAPEIRPPGLLVPRRQVVELVRVSESVVREAALAAPVRRVFRAPQRVVAGEARTAPALLDVDATLEKVMVGGDPRLPSGGDRVVSGLPEIAPPARVKAPEREVRERVRVGGDVMQAKLRRQVRPDYPEIARRARIEGEVLLLGVITREGRVANLRVLHGHPLLVRAALAAVSQWEYEPTLLNGASVEVEAPITVRFRLGR
jgi:TonB family protein